MTEMEQDEASFEKARLEITIEELRTRNVELEKQKSSWERVAEHRLGVMDELRTRVAELTKKGENLCTSHGLLLCAHDTLKKKNEELQNRLSQAEEKEKELRENWLEDMQEWSVEKATLLKASEGMEKALEEAVRDCEVFDVSGALEKNFPSTIHAIRENQKRYAKALADFRALKETK